MVSPQLQNFFAASYGFSHLASQTGTALPTLLEAARGVQVAACALQGDGLPLGPHSEAMEGLQKILQGDVNSSTLGRAVNALEHQVRLFVARSDEYDPSDMLVSPTSLPEGLYLDVAGLSHAPVEGARSFEELQRQLETYGRANFNLREELAGRGVTFLGCLPAPVADRVRVLSQRALRIVRHDLYGEIPVDVVQARPILGEPDLAALRVFESWLPVTVPGLDLAAALSVFEAFLGRVRAVGHEDAAANRAALVNALRDTKRLRDVGYLDGVPLGKEGLIKALEEGSEVPANVLAGFHPLLRHRATATTKTSLAAVAPPPASPPAEPAAPRPRAVIRGVPLTDLPDTDAMLARAKRLRTHEHALAGFPETWGTGKKVESGFGFLGQAREHLDGTWVLVCRHYAIESGDDPKARRLIAEATQRYQRPYQALFEVRYELAALSSGDLLAYWVAMNPEEAAKALQAVRSSAAHSGENLVSFTEGPENFVQRLQGLRGREQELMGLPALRLQDVLFYLRQFEFRRSLAALRGLNQLQPQLESVQGMVAQIEEILEKMRRGQPDLMDPVLSLVKDFLGRELAAAQGREGQRQNMESLQELTKALEKSSKKDHEAHLKWSLRWLQQRVQVLTERIGVVTEQVGVCEGLSEAAVQGQIEDVTRRLKEIRGGGYGLMGEAREDIVTARLHRWLETKFPNLDIQAEPEEKAAVEIYQRLEQEWFEVLREIYAINFADPLVYHVVMHPEGVANELRFLGFQLQLATAPKTEELPESSASQQTALRFA